METKKKMAHDIKSGLSVIKAYAQMLEKKIENTNNEKYVQKIVKKVDELTEYIDKSTP